MIDHFSKFRWASSIANKTAEAVVEFVSTIFGLFGHPVLLHTDYGTEFANNNVEEECRQWGTYIIHGRPYYPQSQGAIERPNGALQKAMKGYKLVYPEQEDWTIILREAIRFQNKQVYSVTNLEPWLCFERYNRLPRQSKPISRIRKYC